MAANLHGDLETKGNSKTIQNPVWAAPLHIPVSWAETTPLQCVPQPCQAPHPHLLTPNDGGSCDTFQRGPRSPPQGKKESGCAALADTAAKLWRSYASLLNVHVLFWGKDTTLGSRKTPQNLKGLLKCRSGLESCRVRKTPFCLSCGEGVCS